MTDIFGSIFDRVAGQVSQAAFNTISLPGVVSQNLPLANALLSGDPTRIINSALDKVLGVDFGSRPWNLPFFGAAQFNTSALVGGITLTEAKEIFQRVAATNFAKSNLYFINITDLQQGAHSIADINLFTQDVSYTPITITGDKIRVGSGSVDTISHKEPVEISIATLDDQSGSVKKWFNERASKATHSDGTCGLPMEYLMRVTIMHAFIGAGAAGAQNAVVDTYVMRPGTLSYSMSRRTDALSELNMTFSQFDSFTGVV